MRSACCSEIYSPIGEAVERISKNLYFIWAKRGIGILWITEMIRWLNDNERRNFSRSLSISRTTQRLKFAFLFFYCLIGSSWRCVREPVHRPTPKLWRGGLAGEQRSQKDSFRRAIRTREMRGAARGHYYAVRAAHVHDSGRLAEVIYPKGIYSLQFRYT